MIMSKVGFCAKQNSRCFSVNSFLNQKNLYETLGVTRKATQAEVKSAFYKLSKQHHPDANVNDSSATARFQEIVEAYEILGNEAARKRYDVGMPQDLHRSSTSRHGFKSPDDPQAAFYKSRLVNKVHSPSTGRTYNVDAWTKQHYSNAIKSHQRDLKQRAAYKSSEDHLHDSPNLNRPNLQQKFAAMLVSFIIVCSIVIIESENYDKPKPKR